MSESFDVIIIGAGPAGLMAGACAALRGRKTLVLDKNPRPGAKILISGGTRSNVTHATDRRGIIEAFGPQGWFLHSALAALGPEELVDLLESEGVPTKIEDTGKVFPASDRAADVVAALVRRLRRNGCATAWGEPLERLEPTGQGFRLLTSKRTLNAKSVVLATGGQSYPGCGTTGDGYRIAAALGHRIVPPCPALVPVTTHADWVRALQGITLPDVVVCVRERLASRDRQPADTGKTETGAAEFRRLAQRRGAVLFAHFGLSGPAVLDVSRAVSGHPRPNTLVLGLDLLPATGERELESLLKDHGLAAGKRQPASLLSDLVPGRLADMVVHKAGLPPDRRAAELSRDDRRRMARTVKQLDIPVAGTMGFKKAEVTAGGIALEEVDSHTMQSHRVPGLYFAGELLDLDGPIGGYNFQAAFSTGWLAGEHA